MSFNNSMPQGGNLTTSLHIANNGGTALYIDAQPVIMDLAIATSKSFRLRHEGKLYQLRVIGRSDADLVAILRPIEEGS